MNNSMTYHAVYRCYGVKPGLQYIKSVNSHKITKSIEKCSIIRKQYGKKDIASRWQTLLGFRHHFYMQTTMLCLQRFGVSKISYKFLIESTLYIFSTDSLHTQKIHKKNHECITSTESNKTKSESGSPCRMPESKADGREEISEGTFNLWSQLFPSGHHNVWRALKQRQERSVETSGTQDSWWRPHPDGRATFNWSNPQFFA